MLNFTTQSKFSLNYLNMALNVIKFYYLYKNNNFKNTINYNSAC